MNTEIMYGIEYSKPEVILLQETGIGTSEYAARTCYDSFESSENSCVSVLDTAINFDSKNDKLFGHNKKATLHQAIKEVNNIEHSSLLDQLAWTHFHHSILEHANLTYLIKGTPRGVLQEHARHRIQAISVRSTRYTMSSVINAFIASQSEGKEWFVDKFIELDLLVTTTIPYCIIEAETVYEKLRLQSLTLGSSFNDIAIAKSSMDFLIKANSSDELFEMLEAGKKKRNVGDAFKHIVTDNWKVDMVVTMNLRALKNYLTLRDSGAAYFQIRWLAEAMKQVTPKKYLELIIKEKDTNV